ncbi:MAG: helix-turn-helix transcriptional regulator [Peptococcaceae bacterium]|jgi:transcriptional regulator with XRE-family HTH domain|nr:helix-turn-helix transcriptional regulator [Peptococcaceae bacterium]
MDIAARIVELRKEKGYSTTKLARLAGIAQSTLREIEIGKTSPTWDTILKICQALEIGVPSLLDDDPAETYGNVLRETPEEYRTNLPPDRILGAARRLTPRQRKLLLEVMEEWVRLNRP